MSMPVVAMQAMAIHTTKMRYQMRTMSEGISTRMSQSHRRRGATAAIVLLFALGCASAAQAQGTLAPVPQQVFLDASGNPLNNGKICTYAAGTTTQQATYFDQDLAVAHQNANPVRTNSAGRPTTGGIYLSATSYKILILSAGTDGTCSTGTTIYSQDGVSAVPSTNVALDVTGTAGEALAAGDTVYLSDGSGALNAGRWYKADADFTYAATTPQVGIAVAAIASGSSGSLRVGGRMTGLSALTAGTTYYVSATAGALTSTAPTNARTVGQADSTTSLVVGDAASAGILQRTVRINASTPYTWTMPTANAAGMVTSSSTGAISIIPYDNGTAGGRLTATTATCITTADVSAATSIFYTPCGSDRISLYDGTTWNLRTFTEITISVTACTASKPYDVFLIDAGAGAQPTSAILVWTNDTTRATALTRQNGIWVKTGATTQRYVGSFYCNASGGQTDDTLVKRYVYNEYNRAPRVLRRIETGGTWNYTTATIRQANGSTANQVEVMVGNPGIRVAATLSVDTYQTNAGIARSAGFGEDSTTTFMAQQSVWAIISGFAAASDFPIMASLSYYPAVGRHTYSWNEVSAAGTGTTTWVGSGASPSLNQGGIEGGVEY